MRLLMFLPESTWVLVITGLGIAVMVRVISVKAAFGIIGSLVLISLLEPLYNALFDALPLWLLVLIIAVFCLSTLRWLMSLVFGHSVTNHLTAMILHDILCCRFVLSPGCFAVIDVAGGLRPWLGNQEGKLLGK